ncbi:hypothetical protein CJ030_MR3G019159 [Morella rubra]|uniref:Uncharacterized protein n=1 Tax=Morella rubra TaxID=262757 RepID=A0A6A1W5V5_9ROSI|nr:hypothetical protein CJ030_MR3G019159 [Morella rubra]
MANYLIALLRELLLDIILKAITRTDLNPYVLDDIENSLFTLLSICETCKTLCDALDCDITYRSCHIEEILDLVTSPLKVSKFVCQPAFRPPQPRHPFLEGYPHHVRRGQLY